MTYKNHIDLILKEFGQMTGLKELELDENNYCCMVFDEKLFVDLEYEAGSDQLVLSSNIGAPGNEHLFELYRRLLQFNYLWKESGGMTLSLDPSDSSVNQIQIFQASGLNFEQFQVILENFINSAEEWTTAIQRFEPEGKRDSLPEQPLALLNTDSMA